MKIGMKISHFFKTQIPIFGNTNSHFFIAHPVTLIVLQISSSLSLMASLNLSLVNSLCTRYFEKTSLSLICSLRSNPLCLICIRSFGFASSIKLFKSVLMFERSASNCFSWSRANLHVISSFSENT